MKKAVDDELRNATFRSQDLVAMERIVVEEKRKLRNDTIEECARVADALADDNGVIAQSALRFAAASIRALKEKP